MAGGAHDDILSRRFDIPGRQFHTIAAYQLAHFVEGQSIAPQGGFGKFNGNLVVARPDNIDLRNMECGQQIVPYLLGRLFESALRLIAVNRNIDDLILLFELNKPRLFGFIRKRVDFSHFIFNFISHCPIVDARLKLGKNQPHPFIGIGKNAAHAFNGVNRLFHFHHDTFLNFFRRCAFKLNANLDEIKRQLRHHLTLQAQCTPPPSHDNHHHQEIGCHRIVDGSLDETLHISPLD